METGSRSGASVTPVPEVAQRGWRSNCATLFCVPSMTNSLEVEVLYPT